MKKIVVAVIGCGVIAPTHAEALRTLPEVELRYAVDLLPERAERLRSRFGFTRALTDFHQALADPEVNLVSVCTEHAAHAEPVIAALAAGKNVICEKPLGANPAQLRAMLEAHRRRPDLIFGGIFQHRFEPVNRVLRELLAEGAFGQLLNVNLFMNCLRTNAYYQADAWRGTWAREGGGVLINQAIHHLDLLRFLFGEVAEVTARCVNAAHQGVIETEDNAALALRFESGVLGAAAITNASAENWRSGLIISGTSGYLEYLDEQPTRMEFGSDERNAEIAERFRRALTAPETLPGKAYYGGGHRAQLADLVAAIREGRPPEVTAETAAGTVRLVCAIYASSRSGNWMRPGELI